MIKRKVYIFNSSSRAAKYGVGTYIQQLIDCLKNINIEFEVVYLNATGNEVVVSNNLGYKQISIPSVKSCVKRNVQYYARNVVYLLKEYIPENKDILNIFHLNFLGDPFLVLNLKKHFKCKVIITIHYTNWGLRLLGDHEKLRKIISNKKKNKDEKKIIEYIQRDKYMLSKCDCFICVAEHTRNNFKNICGYNIENSVVINNALMDCYRPISDSLKIMIKEKYSICNNIKILFFAGRLDKGKGVHFLIKAFKEVIKTNPNVHLFIAGDGNFNEWLSEAKNDWLKITFTGKLDKQQLYEFYSIVDIGIVPSLHEEFGYVALEMMMHALPVVVTDTGGLSEIVEDSISGLKVPVEDSMGERYVNHIYLANKISFLLENPETAKKIGDNGRLRFLDKFELNLFKSKMANLYLDV